MKLLSVSVFLSVLFIGSTLACSAENEPRGLPSGLGVGSGGSSTGSAGSSTGPAAGSGSGSAGSAASAGADSPRQLKPDECGGDYYVAEPRQLDIYIMLDDSGSMVPWWPFVLQALDQFVQAPESAGIGMGLQVFGPDSPCDPQRYAQPRAPIAPLPGNLSALQAAVPLLPVESTPTLPAMQGAIMYAQSWAEAHPDSKVVVWLITDGMPSGCDSTVELVAQAAAEGLTGSIPIPTYVIGIGDLQALDAIAQSGGTDQATIIDPVNMTSAQGLLDAMNALRESALPCDYALPTPDSGGQVDTELVNLYFTPAGGQETVIPNVDGIENCDPAQGGWFYNDSSTRLIACDSTCEMFKTTSGQVNVILGCPMVRIE
jgi:hypothetical protein